MGCCFACFWNDDVNENNQNDIVSIGALSNLSGQEPAAVVTTAGDAREKNDKEKGMATLLFAIAASRISDAVILFV